MRYSVTFREVFRDKHVKLGSVLLVIVTSVMVAVAAASAAWH